jgi:hypothetical protein
MKTNVVTIIAVLAIAAGFGGGYFFRNRQIQVARGNFGANGNFQRFTGNRNNGIGGMMGRGGVTGSIISMDDKSITVKINDGSTKIVLFSDSTTYRNTVDATKSDLKVGSEVAVFGAANSDGSVTATSIQLNPEFFGMTPLPSPASK